ncbi:MAG: phosphate ABC transporter ATP-binding protein [Thermoanaerobaculia bacterium]
MPEPARYPHRRGSSPAPDGARGADVDTAAAPGGDPGRERAPEVAVRGLSVHARGAGRGSRGGSRRRTILRDVELTVHPGEVLGLVGSSGVGKSTLLKCLNRLVDLEPGLSVSGRVLLAGEDLYRRRVDPDRLRTRIGMLFQQPVVFPGSIWKNTLFGLRHAGTLARREWAERGERALREAALWDEVADRLGEPAGTLSTGQQQRLCLARALALDPDVLLMDEPTSALDARASRRIEELVRRLAGRRTVLLVSHDPEQVRRVADRAACVAACEEGGGTVVACAPCDALFDDPRCCGMLQTFDGDRS